METTFRNGKTKDHLYKYYIFKSQSWFRIFCNSLFLQKSTANTGFLFGDIMIKGYSGPDWCGSVGCMSASKAKGCRFDSMSRHMPGCRPG